MLTTRGVHEHLEGLDAWEGADFGELSIDAALEVAATAVKVRHALDAVVARSLGRVDALCEVSPGSFGPARRRGHANAAALASSVTGLGPGESHRFIELGRSLLAADAAAADAAADSAPPDQSASGEFAVEPSVFDPLAPGGDAPGDVTPSPTTYPPGHAPGDGSGLLDPASGNGLLGDETGSPAAGAAPPPPVPGAYLTAAIDAGTIGHDKAEVVRLTLDDFTIDTIEIERDFVDYAHGHSLRQLKKYGFAKLGELDVNGLMERERRQVRSRFLSVTDGADAMITVFGKFDVMTGASIKTLLDELTARGVRAQRDLPKRERFEPGQIMADALSDIAKHAMTCNKVPKRAKTTVFVRVNKEDLIVSLHDLGKVDERGRPLGADGVGTCDGVLQPISATMARMMAVDAQILPAVMGGDPIPLDLGYTERFFTPEQSLAIIDRDGGCVKCDKPPAYCHTHHVVFWRDDGPTDVDNGAMLCTGCHHRLHEQFWRLEKNSTGYFDVIETPSSGGVPPSRPQPPGGRPPTEHLSRPERPAQLPAAQRKPAPGPAPGRVPGPVPGAAPGPAPSPAFATAPASEAPPWARDLAMAHEQQADSAPSSADLLFD